MCTVNYSAIKRNQILIHTTTWMNLENSTPGELDQKQKDTCWVMIPLIELSRRGTFMETESRQEVTSCQRSGECEIIAQ